MKESMKNCIYNAGQTINLKTQIINGYLKCNQKLFMSYVNHFLK